ncbi:MAG: DUF1538 domain-containing protein [Candidatus Methanomethylophilaceae archaeon]|nr:DUF1538 domain-containing protein [Candidatus Methanomethylophilaceae archaeon]
MNADSGILDVIVEVVTALLPLIVFFLIFQTLFLKFPWNRLKRIITGLLVAGLGMIIFLYAVYTGFMPISTMIGEYMMENLDPLVIVGFGFLIGFMATFAEPAVRVLTYQVEQHSTGFMNARLLLLTLSLGVGAFVALGMAKVVYSLDFHSIIISGYLLAMVLMIFCDRDFVSVAFDAGGVATGPMAVSLLMAMMTGLAEAKPGADPLLDGFGIIALIALAPIIFITGLGVIIRIKSEESEQK